jgi:hypothetical protein
MRRHLDRRRFLRAAVPGASGLLFGPAHAAEKAPAGLKPLMLDPKAVQRRRNIELRMRRPAPHRDNPILSPERPWEYGYVYATTVRYESKSGRWRMWYLGAPEGKAIDKRFCLAESRDAREGSGRQVAARQRHPGHSPPGSTRPPCR